MQCWAETTLTDFRQLDPIISVPWKRKSRLLVFYHDKQTKHRERKQAPIILGTDKLSTKTALAAV